jgi:HK97 family phage major capsid protein
MTKKEYETKRAGLMDEIKGLLKSGKTDDASIKMKDVETLDKDFSDTAAAVAAAAALEAKKPVVLDNIAVDVKGEVKETMNENKTTLLDVSSAAYHDAFFNRLRGQELNDEQRNAYEAVNGVKLSNAMTTTTESPALPTTTLNQIWDLCVEQHAILGDIDRRITGVIIDIPVRSAITAGKGAKVSENTANADMADTKSKVTLSGNDFSATVEISYAAAKMAIPALEQFIVKDVAQQIGYAMAADVVTTVESNIATANKITSAATTAFTFLELAKLFGQLKRCSSFTAYVTNKTLYNQLVSMVDTTGRPIFQTTMQAGAAGALLGATLKLEDAVADNVILVGDPKAVICNVVQDIMVETERDIKTHTIVYSSYSRAQSVLMDSESFAMLTLKTA